MVDFGTYLIFVTGVILLLLTPGPAVLYIVARTVDQGRLAGLVSTLGIGVGTLFHVFAAALGVSTILLHSAVAFTFVKFAGAIYLVYLGIRKLFEKESGNGGAIDPHPPTDLHRVFREGILVNFLNPKTALFFFAFLPQFVDPSLGFVAWQIVFLGLTFIFLGVLSDSAWVFAAHRVSRSIRGSALFVSTGRFITGGIYIGLGLATAFVGNGRK